jgi:hypothetical protein
LAFRLGAREEWTRVRQPSSSVVISGSLSGRVVINGRVIDTSGAFNSGAQEQLTGVTSKADIGTVVTILTDASVQLENAGDNLRVKAGGSLSAGDLGTNTNAEISGDVSAGNMRLIPLTQVPLYVVSEAGRA